MGADQFFSLSLLNVWLHVMFWKAAGRRFQTIVHSKKTEPRQPQLVDWYERRPLHDPNKVFAYWPKKKTTTFGAKTIVLFKNWVLGVVPSRCRLNTAVLAAQSTSFLLLSIFRLHGCHFSGWGSRVGGLLISETSIFTIDNGDEAGKGWTTEPWRQIDKGGVLSKKHVCFDIKKVQESSFVPAHVGVFAVVLSASHQCSCSAKSSATGLCTPHVGMVYVRRTPAANACLWVKRQNHWFSREKRKVAFPR